MTARHKAPTLILVSIAAVAAGSCEMFRGAFTRPRDLVVDRPAEAVAAARGMIDAQRKDPATFGSFLRPDALPLPLRVKGLRYAHVHRDHVDLVLARNPDFEIGGRIWAVDHRPHEDTVTKYPEIHFYQYNNDSPESPDNIP